MNFFLKKLFLTNKWDLITKLKQGNYKMLIDIGRFSSIEFSYLMIEIFFNLSELSLN
jgi:hypothetical protein